MSNLPDESFRDTIATINAEGKRNFIYPKKPSGPFYDKRKLLSYFLLVFLIASPFITTLPPSGQLTLNEVKSPSSP